MDAAGVATVQFASLLDELQDAVLQRGLDRALEFDADAAAVQMAYRAGYDPKQLPRAIRRIEEVGLKPGGEAFRGEGLKSWSSLHPPTAERINRVRLLLSLLPQQDGLALATERFQSSR